MRDGLPGKEGSRGKKSRPKRRGKEKRNKGAAPLGELRTPPQFLGRQTLGASPSPRPAAPCVCLPPLASQGVRWGGERAIPRRQRGPSSLLEYVCVQKAAAAGGRADSQALLLQRTFSSSVLRPNQIGLLISEKHTCSSPKCLSFHCFSKINDTNLHLSASHISWPWHIWL